MEVILAGVNIDWEALAEIKARSGAAGEELTPETISAAYARISRNPLPVDQLRRLSREEVEKARRSNQSIVFDMGHSSIAEHAVFNIDILGVSRLAVEFIEKFRLASYTEKSQRYIRLEDDFVIPDEIRDAGLSDIFTDTVLAQNALYRDLYKAVFRHVSEKEGASANEPARRSLLEGSAKEDARYIISLATESQLGMTLNARALELMLRRAAAHRLAEIRAYGQKLYSATKPVAPSLIRYTEATSYDRDTHEAMEERVKKIDGYLHEQHGAEPDTEGNSVILINATEDGDELVISSLIQSSLGFSMESCRKIARNLPVRDKEAIIRTACARMEAYDAPPREFEMADLIFEAVMSAACFAQMKRHRIATIISRDYDTTLGATVPETIREAGMEAPFRSMVSRTNEVYERLRDAAPEAAAYILTNSHRRRVLIKVNVRELYHISRLREDAHAQWDIRDCARQMVNLGRKVMPLSLMFACGKDAFQELKNRQIDNGKGN